MFNLRVYLTNTVLACFDVTVTALCYIAIRFLATHISISDYRRLLSFEEATSLVLVLVLWISLSSYFGMYQSRRLDSPIADVLVCLKTALAAWVVGRMAAVLLPASWPPMYLTFSFVIANLGALTIARPVLRLCLREMRRRGYNVKRLLLIASEEFGDKLEQKFARRSHYGYRITSRLVYTGGAGADQNLLEEA